MVFAENNERYKIFHYMFKRWVMIYLLYFSGRLIVWSRHSDALRKKLLLI